MFASKRKAEPNGHDPAPLPIAGDAVELPVTLPQPPAMLDSMARRLLGVSFGELQKIGSEVGEFIKEAKQRVEAIERQNAEILALLKERK